MCCASIWVFFDQLFSLSVLKRSFFSFLLFKTQSNAPIINNYLKKCVLGIAYSKSCTYSFKKLLRLVFAMIDSK